MKSIWRKISKILAKFGFCAKKQKIANLNQHFEIRERCKGVHCVDLGESFPTSIYLQKSASIQPRTSPSKFGGKYSILFNRVLTYGAVGAAAARSVPLQEHKNTSLKGEDQYSTKTRARKENV